MSKLNILLGGLSFTYLMGNILYVGYHGIFLGDHDLGVIGSMDSLTYSVLFSVSAVVFIVTMLREHYERGY